MQERLIIKNFGPIKEADLTFGRFNVLIGEQATGKSTVLKLLAVCRYFSYLCGVLAPKRDPFTDGLWDWGLGDSRRENTYIKYVCKDYQLVYKNVQRIDLSGQNFVTGTGLYDFELSKHSERFKQLLHELAELQKDDKGIPYTFFKTSVTRVMENPLFLGTERDSNFLDFQTSFLKGLIENAEKLRQIKSRFSKETKVEPLSISYLSEGNSPSVKKDEEDSFHQLSHSASGYQAAVPIVLSVKSYTNPPELDERLPAEKTRTKTFIIEEPELNLFPTTQYEVVKFLVDKTLNFGNTMFISTHSPYVLSALNNLMNAYQSGNSDEKATESVVAEKYWLNAGDVSAYLLKSDGTHEDLIDGDEGMIKSEKIDEVSGILNREFDQLLNIQFGIKNAES